MKKGHHSHIEQETIDNANFRKVLYTGEHIQLVLMNLQPLEEIGMETHEQNDQFFRFESGQGRVIINDSHYTVIDGDAIIVPAGAPHNIINTSDTLPLKLYTIYTPPHHADGIVRGSRSDALANEAEFDGVTTE